jgi:glyoxylase-like metal-dependent hydrolase (beta-lactamase superfamily II)
MADHKLKYVKTGAVPGREDLLIQGGDLNMIRMAPVSLFYVPMEDGVLLVDSSFTMEDAKTMGAEDAVERKLPAEDPLTALKIAGVEPKDVTHLILTHAHFDHVGNVDKFPNAKVYIHRKELAWVMALPSWSIGYGPFSVEKLQRIWKQLVPLEGDFVEVLPGIETVYAGGHSAGSLAVCVDTKKGKVCLCGDNCFLYENIEKRTPIGLTNNLYESLAFMEKLPALGDILIPGHDPLFFERFPGGVIA